MSEAFDFDSVPPSRLKMDSRPTSSQPALDRVFDEPHLLDYVRVLYKRRWIAGSAFLVILLTTIVYTFTATPRYEGRVQLLIEPENPNVVNFKEVIDADQAKADYYQTQYKLLQSRELARKTIDTLKLWDNNEIGSGAQSRGVRDLLALIPGWPAAAPELPAQAGDETTAEAKTIDAFLDHLVVAPVRNSRLVDVAFQSKDPRLAARVANAVAKGYINQNLEFKFLSSKEANDWLSGQLGEQRTKVEQTEAALQRYLEQNDALSLDQRQDIVVQKLADLNAAVTRAKTVRIEKEAIYKQLENLQAGTMALDTFPSILTNGFIQQQKTELANLQRQLASMSEKMGDNHPDIIKTKSAIQVAESRLQGEIAEGSAISPGRV